MNEWMNGNPLKHKNHPYLDDHMKTGLRPHLAQVLAANPSSKALFPLTSEYYIFMLQQVGKAV